MLILVCGSRNWNIMGPVMARLEKLPKLSTIVEGGCEGADKLARQAADVLGFDVIEYPANWNGRGKAAGPYRNRKMLDLKPDLVIAFHENLETSKGTADTVREAKRRGIPVEVITGRESR